MKTKREIRKKVISFYQHNDVEAYRVSSPFQLWERVFSSLSDAVNYLLDNMDPKTLISESGELISRYSFDPTPPMKIKAIKRHKKRGH